VRDAGLTSAPTALSRLPPATVRTLDLAGNRLASLPAAAAAFAAMTRLTLDRNPPMAALPDMANWRALKALSVVNCSLHALPPSVAHCAALTKVRRGGDPRVRVLHLGLWFRFQG